MRNCTNCGLEKIDSEFAWKSKALNQRRSWCNDCRRAKDKQAYERNREKAIAASRARTQAKQQQLVNYKQTLSCYVCGESDDSCLDFHHLNPGEKEFSVSMMVHRVSWSALMHEVDKCICLCANCHRKVHAHKLMILQGGRRVVAT